MKPADDTKADIGAILNDLKWSVADLRMAGIRDWPMKRRQPGDRIPIEVESVLGRINSEQALVHISEDIGDCHRCRLDAGRTKIVLGVGSPQAKLVFVGEGPGFDEDQQGQPFVGKAGKLLDKMILALGFTREEVYIANVVKCRPPNNRTPLPDEIQTCSPFLFRQLEAIAPQVICALGACAAQTLLGASHSISSLRGKKLAWRGIPLVCTFHPAYLLRNPSQKAATWQDLLVVYAILAGSQEDK
ncbi:MAG TPA: uracil-DNA glycosylase [Syntrophobacteraceae bacterium]|nr:uracil-DNA glycosylase [Syntrophobacteraceae bacterium]